MGAGDSDLIESLEKSSFLDVTGQDHCGESCWIVTVIIGVSPAVRLYETQKPAFGYRTSLYFEPSALASKSAPNTCCGVITPEAPFMKSTEMAVTLLVALS